MLPFPVLLGPDIFPRPQAMLFSQCTDSKQDNSKMDLKQCVVRSGLVWPTKMKIPILYKARNVTSELLAASKQCCLSTDL